MKETVGEKRRRRNGDRESGHASQVCITDDDDDDDTILVDKIRLDISASDFSFGDRAAI